MWRKVMFTITLTMLLLSGWAAAQEITPEPIQQGTLSVTGAEPSQIFAGQTATLSVFGTDFTSATTVRLIGFGLLNVSLINSGAITAVVPATVPPGQYIIEVSDPATGSAANRPALTVVAVPPTAGPTAVPATAVPTPEPPTPIPGQPALIVRSFSAQPASVARGGTVSMTIEVINQGNRTAQGVTISLDSGSKFVPAAGQASALLPDMQPGASFTVQLAAIAALDTPPGPNSVPITMSYRDFSGTAYTTKSTLSIVVDDNVAASQVTLARYIIDPNPVEAGQPVTITALITNSGSQRASQVLLRVTGSDSVLLAGPNGDSFPVGDLDAGASTSVTLPMIVSSSAKAGPQSQPVTISFLQNGEAQERTSSMTVPVRASTEAEPLMLLQTYDTGSDVLQPGQQFTLTMQLQNVGSADASNVLVTFGTVESSGGGSTPGGNPGSDGGGSGGGSGGSSSSTSTTPSSTFAPIGAGGTLFVGSVPSGGEAVTVTQEFIVNGTVTSGIYSLPITLRYEKPDGSSAQDNLRASVIVVVPAQLRTEIISPVPEMVNVGEPVTISVGLSNVGKNTVNTTNARVIAENAEVVSGAEVFIGPIKADDDFALDAVVIPSGEGQVSITIAFDYTDDLNRPQTLELPFEAVAAIAPTPEPFVPPPDFGIEETPQPDNNDLLGRLLLGFLGLGS